MRIVSGGVQHETNTFAHSQTTLKDFIRDSHCGPELAGGEAILARYRNTGTIHGGYIAETEMQGVNLTPVMNARCQPSGIVKQTCFDALLTRLLERIDRESPCDGVLLDLHGAMVAESHEDAEGAILQAVRERIGHDVPLIATLDLHGNITPLMAEQADVLIGFDTYPHVDMFDRGREAAALLIRMIRGEVQPVQAFRQLPMITMPPMQCTLRQPMQSYMEFQSSLKMRPGVLTATTAMGFPFADIRDAGATVLVSSHDDEALAQALADELAERLWSLREQLEPKLTTIEEAIAFAERNPDQTPVIFADGSDNPGGGAPCDGTVALQALLDANCEGSVVAVLFDPETAAQAHEAGVGATITATLGGKSDDQHGPSVPCEAYVRALCDGRFTYRGAMMQGVEDHLGRTATLVVNGVEVVVSSVRRQCLDTEMLRIAGIEPTRRKLLVLKSAVHFRADFADVAKKMFDADTPGVHRPDFTSYDYRRVRRPIYPLDRNLTWKARR